MCAGGWGCGLREGDPRPVRIDWRIDAGAACPRSRGYERLNQRRRAFDLCASRPAAESTYAGIVRLVEEAQRSKAPMSRLADRYSLLFLGLTVALAMVAWWVTGDPIRAVAVLVVATPCPLILAVPVALVAGCLARLISGCSSRAPSRSRRWRASARSSSIRPER